MCSFEVPVVLFTFKRKEKALQILERIAGVRPKTLYIFSDGPRNPEETSRVEACRRALLQRVDWPCRLVTKFEETNRGVLTQIGFGAMEVLSQEGRAIFLEDDTLPDITFFRFCQEMLDRYDEDPNVLWVCGTNYCGTTKLRNNASYGFTRHMMPCGWASWGHKFNTYYDPRMTDWDDPLLRRKAIMAVEDRRLRKQLTSGWETIRASLVNTGTTGSWDGQMSFALRRHGLIGIFPSTNLITNIGVDEDSIHGGNSLSIEMTSRFCEIPSRSLLWPYNHPLDCHPDARFEKETTKIVLLPIMARVKGVINQLIKRLLGVSMNESIWEYHLVKKLCKAARKLR